MKPNINPVDWSAGESRDWDSSLSSMVAKKGPIIRIEYAEIHFLY